MDSDKIKLTGLWKSQTKAGEAYLAGKISPSMRLLILPNSYKKSDKEPDFIAYMTPAKEEAEEPASRKAKEVDPWWA